MQTLIDGTRMLNPFFDLPAWINWTPVGGKKLPVSPATGQIKIDANDPAHHVTYSQARARSPNVGRVFSDRDPFVGIDVDVYKDRVRSRPIVESLAPLTLGQLSPSGQGFHFYGYGPKIPNRTNILGCVELFSTSGFMTVPDGWLEPPLPLANLTSWIAKWVPDRPPVSIVTPSTDQRPLRYVASRLQRKTALFWGFNPSREDIEQAKLELARFQQSSKDPTVLYLVDLFFATKVAFVTSDQSYFETLYRHTPMFYPHDETGDERLRRKGKTYLPLTFSKALGYASQKTSEYGRNTMNTGVQLADERKAVAQALAILAARK